MSQNCVVSCECSMFRIDVQKDFFFLAQVNLQFNVVYNLKDLATAA